MSLSGAPDACREELIITDIGPQPMRVFRASGIDKLVEIKEAVS